MQVRHKVHIDFVRDRDAGATMKPLYECGVAGMVSLEGRELVYDLTDQDPVQSRREALHTDTCVS